MTWGDGRDGRLGIGRMGRGLKLPCLPPLSSSESEEDKEYLELELRRELEVRGRRDRPARAVFNAWSRSIMARSTSPAERDVAELSDR